MEFRPRYQNAFREHRPESENESMGHEHHLNPAYGEILLHWQEPEHDPLELGPRSRVGVTIALILIVAYALYTDSPLMAITFILIGVIGYLSLHHEPRVLDYFVTSKGIVAGDQFYEYDSLQSFWIYTEPPLENVLSLQTDGMLVPYVHIPVMTVNIHTLADTLSQFMSEERHEPGLVDTLERLLHI